MIVSLLLFAVGMMLSAFFSGSETGFYRLNRARLVIGAIDGDWNSRGLLWAANNPSLFVATALVGNNVANYVTSAAIVMAAATGLSGWPSAEMIAPLVLAPVIFVYGELLPKNIFLAAPNRMTRKCAIPFGIAAVLFAPVSLVLWMFNKVLEIVGNKSPQEVQMVLARRELGQLLDEGHAVGLLQPTQQLVAQATLTLGGKPVSTFMVPTARMARARHSMTAKDIVALAKRTGSTLLPVEGSTRGDAGKATDKSGRSEVAGYVRVADCLLCDQDAPLQVRPMLNIEEHQSFLTALSRMLAIDAQIARVENRKQQTVGYVTLAELQEALLAE